MPVLFETISNPIDQDLQDLISIYQDYPTPVADDIETWIQESLIEGNLLFAGRFNGRLLSALWGTVTTQGLELHHLCVRQLTRRRSVASQLLTLLTKHADQQKLSLLIQHQPELDPLAKHLATLGFNNTNNHWLRTSITP